MEGTGPILVGDVELCAAPGKLAFVPAGVPHGFRNDFDGGWLVRATVHERLYTRAVLKLLRRAVLKRLGLAPR
jgi:mannose-6-phosphate isomerase-like protein (cupin superfamily)